MHRTGKYRSLNLIFGIFPFVAAVLLARMREDSHPIVLWISIVSVAQTRARGVTSANMDLHCADPSWVR